jgi:hypothetical protein
MEIDDFDSHGQLNDLAPDEPAPRAPEGDPHRVTDEFRVWLFEGTASNEVEDAYVVARQPNPLDFRMWVFQGRGDEARFVMRASHKYGENETIPGGREDCCEVLFDGQSLSDEHCPKDVETLVEDLTAGTVVTPDQQSNTDSDGPINY